MNLEPSTEQTQVAQAAREWLGRQLPISKIRSFDMSDEMPDESTWTAVSEMGWLGLGISEDRGGIGLGAAEEVMLFRELGRGLAPGPFLPSVLAAHAAERGDASRLSEQILAGQRRVGLRVGDRALNARKSDLVLTLDGDRAVLELPTDFIQLAPTDPLTPIGEVGEATRVLDVADATLLARGRTLAAAQALGIAEAVRDMSVAYASTRTQFGRPIGSFQAVKHRCADMAIAAYAATGQVFHAAVLIDAGKPEASFEAAAAFAVATSAAAKSAADNIQNHGGIGFTWEHDAHLYLKRATVLRNTFGPFSTVRRDLLRAERYAPM